MELQTVVVQGPTNCSSVECPMTLDGYQKRAATTITYSLDGALVYAVLGLTSEAGEVAGKLKKFIREDYGVDDARRLILDELGDVLWYCAAVASSLNATLEEVASQNLVKLSSRADRGVLRGSGDKR